jgi:hypothetical protein
MHDIRQLLAGMDPRPHGAISEDDLDAAIREIDQQSQEFRARHGLERLREVSTWGLGGRWQAV